MVDRRYQADDVAPPELGNGRTTVLAKSRAPDTNARRRGFVDTYDALPPAQPVDRDALEGHTSRVPTPVLLLTHDLERSRPLSIRLIAAGIEVSTLCATETYVRAASEHPTSVTVVEAAPGMERLLAAVDLVHQRYGTLPVLLVVDAETPHQRGQIEEARTGYDGCIQRLRQRGLRSAAFRMTLMAAILEAEQGQVEASNRRMTEARDWRPASNPEDDLLGDLASAHVSWAAAHDPEQRDLLRERLAPLLERSSSAAIPRLAAERLAQALDNG